MFLRGLIFCCCLCSLIGASNRPLYWGLAFDGSVPDALTNILTSEPKPQLVVLYLQWMPPSSPQSNVPSPDLNRVWSAGAVPCITWEPMVKIDNYLHTIAAEKILSGMYDDYIRSVAKAVKEWKNTVLMRYGHEMNLDHYHWGASTEHFGQQSPQLYQQTFRYVVDLFRKLNVENVLWVFCPNAQSIPAAEWNLPEAYYPGDEYVDILGMDGYNWGGSRQHSFEEVFAGLYQSLSNLSPKKPVWVFETASAGTQSEKNQWLREGINTSHKWGIEAITWFQHSKEEDWPIQVDNTLFPLFTPSPLQEHLASSLKNSQE